MSKLSQAVPFPFNRKTVNGSLKGTGNTFMLSTLGNPRGSYTHTCAGPTNSSFLKHVVFNVDVGPFNVSGLKPAVVALRRIFANVQAQEPVLYNALGTAGMLCCRLVVGSPSAISNHSWGTAIDLTLEGKLDVRGDNRVQSGLLKLFPFFQQERFYWGAAFPTEDSMHFEASEELVRDWVKNGDLGGSSAPAATSALSIGDRGTEVEDLQQRLNLALGTDLGVDGIFGPQTRAAVIEFQRQNGLPLTGVADKATVAKLP